MKTMLVRLRKKKGLSQLELAEELGVSRQAISKWEVGDAVPSIENFKSLAKLYDVPLESLLNGEEHGLEEKAAVQETHEKRDSSKRAKIIIVGILVAVCAVMCVFLYSKMTGKEEKHPIKEIERGEIETSGEFQLTW